MEIGKDYYEILGVLPTAEDVVIRAAYKALAQRYHPDRFDGPSEEANRRMADINEAYSILNNPEKRKEYDSLRGSGTQEGSSYFSEEANDAPPKYDPLEEDWAVASKYYTDLKDIESRLTKISWRLAYSFRAYLLEEKAFNIRTEVANDLEQRFLELYFGSNQEIVSFARELIMEGNKLAAKALNKAVRVLGSNIEPNHIIKHIKQEFAAPSRSHKELMSRYGIDFDGKQYHYNQYRYDKLSDAINYAKLCRKDV